MPLMNLEKPRERDASVRSATITMIRQERLKTIKNTV